MQWPNGCLFIIMLKKEKEFISHRKEGKMDQDGMFNEIEEVVL